MIKIKIFVVVFLLIINHQCSWGVLIPYPFQKDSLTLIEKAYLHVDRDIYFSGEDIWFKAYLIDAMDHLLTDHSRSLHVELISPSLKIISSKIIRLEGGLGNGDFKLPDNPVSGKYIVRAYTNYMRNFSDKLFFRKEISIISENKQPETSGQAKGKAMPIKLEFFPEGGSLIENVYSTIAFKALDNLGNGCDVCGKIFSSDGDLITTFRSSHYGMGSFMLKPLHGLNYHAIFRGADSIDFRNELPESFLKGVTLSASKREKNELLINVKTNPETLQIFSDSDLLLSISVRNEIVNTIPFRIKSLITSCIVPTDYLPDGIIMLTLSTKEGFPISERLVYIEKEIPLKLNIITDRSSYYEREQVFLKISLSGDSIVENQGNVSLSVVDKTLLNLACQYPRTISSWFLLESDIRGPIENPSYYFDSSNTDRLKNLDLLLCTQGWRDFKWKYDTAYFPPEDGFTLSGLINNKNHRSFENSATIGLFGIRNRYMTTVPVDSAGRFKLTGIDLTGEATIIVTNSDKREYPKRSVLMKFDVYNPARVTDSIQKISTTIGEDRSLYLNYYIINEARKKKFKLSDTIPLGEVNIISKLRDPQSIKIENSRSMYIKPDAELIISEHMLGYKNITALLNGKIPGVVVSGDTSIYIRGIGTLSNQLPPLVLIDGNQASFNDLFNMPIHFIDRIDVLKSYGKTSIFGFQGSGGVINLITKAERSDIRINNSSAKLKILGYNNARIFYSPQHSSDSISAFNPDLRNTIYWNPSIILAGTEKISLNYFNGDDKSTICIISEGITSTGIPITGKTDYEVK